MAGSVPTSLGTAATPAGSASQAVTTSAAVPAGGKLWVAVGWFDTVATLSNISGGSVAWTIDQQGKNGGVSLAICSADAPAGIAISTTLTANFSGSVLDRFMTVSYGTGYLTGGAYGSVTQNETTVSWSSTNTTVTAGDILFGSSHTSQASGSPTSTPGGSNVEIDDISTADGDSLTTVYQVGTGASVAASGTWTGSGLTNRDGAVAYQAAASGSNVLHPSVPFMSNGRI